MAEADGALVDGAFVEADCFAPGAGSMAAVDGSTGAFAEHERSSSHAGSARHRSRAAARAVVMAGSLPQLDGAMRRF